MQQKSVMRINDNFVFCFFFYNVIHVFSSTVVWNDWRRSRTCWSRRTGTSSIWPSWTTTSTKRSPSWRPRSNVCTRHHNGCQFPGSTDSGPRRFVRSPPRTATARRGWSSDHRHRNELVAKIWRRQPPGQVKILVKNLVPQAVTSDESNVLAADLGSTVKQ